MRIHNLTLLQNIPPPLPDTVDKDAARSDGTFFPHKVSRVSRVRLREGRLV